MTYSANPVSGELICVMRRLSKELLFDNERVKDDLRKALLRENFNIVGVVDKEFQPHGYTVVFLLAESHAAIHTYPEHGSLVFNLNSCRNSSDGEEALRFLINSWKPGEVEKHRNTLRLS